LNTLEFNTDSSTEIIIQIKCGEIRKNGKNCFNDEDYKKKFFRKNFNIYFLDNLINLDNLSNPFQNIIGRDYMFINPLLGKFINIDYYNIKLENDFGIIFNNYETHKIVKVNSIQHNYMLNNYPEDYSKNDINIITVKIAFSEHAEKYRRVYIKLQHLFVEISAIFRLILLFGDAIVNHFSHRMFFTDLINEYFYNYNEKEEIKKGIENNTLKNKITYENVKTIMDISKENEIKNIEISKSILDNSPINSNFYENFNLDKNNKTIKLRKESTLLDIDLKKKKFINDCISNNNPYNYIDNSDLNISEKRILNKANNNSEIMKIL